MKLTDILSAYMDALPTGIILDETQIARHLKAAVRFFCGHATLKNHPPEDGGVHSPVNADNEIDGESDFDLTPGEFALIKPLWYLYVEYENAIGLEASRGQGLDVYGRASSEIRQELTQLETDMPRIAYVEPVFSV
jgi:hypothetical protein